MRRKQRDRQLIEREVTTLIEMGLLQYLIDEDGNFCYELTDEGHRVNKGETELGDYEKDGCKSILG